MTSGCRERAGDKQEGVYGFVGGHEAWREPKTKHSSWGRGEAPDLEGEQLVCQDPVLCEQDIPDFPCRQ